MAAYESSKCDIPAKLPVYLLWLLVTLLSQLSLFYCLLALVARLLLQIAMSLSTVWVTSANGRAAHYNGLSMLPKEVARAGAGAEGCGRAWQERSSLKPGSKEPGTAL